MHSIWQQTAGALRDSTASEHPTPGAGSASCVAGTLGLGLVLMALQITARKSPDEACDALVARGTALLARLSEQADADVAAFECYVAAARMPSAGADEAEARRAATRVAAIDATRVPLEAAELVAACLALAAAARPHVPGTLAADVLAGADLLAGALHALLRSVNINLASLDDAPLAEALAARGRAVAKRAQALHDAVQRPPV